jgi:RimJ/RimL family protein N-acetyltransferase
MNFDRREQFIIEDRQGNPIGAIHLYGLSKEHQNAFITICIVEQKQNSGYGIEAFVLYLCYMIEKYNFHKVMADVYSHNSHALHLLSKAGFIEEGYFKDHRKKMNQNG